jgi:Integrase core domain.
MRRLTEALKIDPYHLDTDNWPNVLVDNLTPEDKDVYLNRKKAIDFYMKNEMTVTKICDISGLKRHHLSRLIRRCLSFDEEGVLWGYRGLIPQKNTTVYALKNPPQNLTSQDNKKYPGLFQYLLDQYPSIKEVIEDFYFKRRKPGIIQEPRIKVKNLHKKFLDSCRTSGIKISEYPFNTNDLGKRSLERYVKKLESRYYLEGIKRYGDQALVNAKTTGLGEQNHPMTIKPFERVQFDGHRIDVMISIVFKTPEGDEVIKVMDRIWLLAIIDVGTRAILGYYLSLNKEYSAIDVLQCIKNAILPKKKMDLTIPALKYYEQGGFVSEVIEETQWGVWEEFFYDNGKANLANIVRERLTKTLGCSINAGPVNTPTRRALIERFFGILEENGYHRILSTTGSNPSDSRRHEPEKKAVKYKISFEDIQQLTEVLISNYNGTSHSGLEGLSPIEAMQQRISRGFIPRTIPEERRDDLTFFSILAKRQIKGNSKEGKRPFIFFEGVEYRNDIVARNPELIGLTVDLLIDTDDIRSLKAFLTDGSELGIFTASGKWGVVPHNLQTRKQINKLKREKLLQLSTMEDPIEVYHRYLEKRALDNKSDRNKLANLKRQLSNNSLKPKSMDKTITTEVDQAVTSTKKTVEYKTREELSIEDDDSSFDDKFRTIIY